MASSDWEIRPYRLGDEVGILELFNGVFREGNPQFVNRTLAEWKWAFDRPGFEHQTWVAVASGSDQIVGQYTAIPMHLNVRGEKCLAGQAVDTCIEKSYRRSLKREGLFLSLAREWFEHWGCENYNWVVYGYPNEQAFPVGTRVLHYRPVHCPIPKWQRAATEDGWIQSSRRVVPFERFGPKTDALYRALAPKLGVSTWRNAAYQNWRFPLNPKVDYQCLGAWQGEDFLGYVVYRLGWINEKIAPIVDIVVDPDDPETLSALLAEVSRIAQREGFETLETWMPSGFNTANHLRSLNFDPQPGRFNLCIRIFNSFFDLDYAKRSWYYTMADSDIY